MKSTAKETNNREAINDILLDARPTLFAKRIKKRISPITSSGITRTNNEIKDI